MFFYLQAHQGGYYLLREGLRAVGQKGNDLIVFVGGSEPIRLTYTTPGEAKLSALQILKWWKESKA